MAASRAEPILKEYSIGLKKETIRFQIFNQGQKLDRSVEAISNAEFQLV
jgi:hypothetical protein